MSVTWDTAVEPSFGGGAEVDVDRTAETGESPSGRGGVLKMSLLKGFLLAAMLGAFLALIGAGAFVAGAAFWLGGALFTIGWAVLMIAKRSDEPQARCEPVLSAPEPMEG